MKIINLTQHVASKEQLDAGVFEPTDKDFIKNLITYNELPQVKDIVRRALKLMEWVKFNYPFIYDVMIGGANYSNPKFEKIFRENGFNVHYAFSKREAQEIAQDDGTTKMIYSFRHLGFVVFEKL